MKSARIVLLALAVLGLPLSTASTGQAVAQTKEPDITGVWEIYPDPFAGDENTFKELPVPNGGPKLREPYASQWKATRDARDAKLKAGTPLVDPSTLCLPEGMVSGTDLGPSIDAQVVVARLRRNEANRAAH